MAELTLDVARKILHTALAKAVEKKLKPLVISEAPHRFLQKNH